MQRSQELASRWNKTTSLQDLALEQYEITIQDMYNVLTGRARLKQLTCLHVCGNVMCSETG